MTDKTCVFNEESSEQSLDTDAFSKVQTTCICSNIMFEISQRLSMGSLTLLRYILDFARRLSLTRFTLMI